MSEIPEPNEAELLELYEIAIKEPAKRIACLKEIWVLGYQAGWGIGNKGVENLARHLLPRR